MLEPKQKVNDKILEVLDDLRKRSSKMQKFDLKSIQCTLKEFFESQFSDHASDLMKLMRI